MDKLQSVYPGMMIGNWMIVKVGKNRCTVRMHNARAVVAKEFTFLHDGTGYKRQGQYLRSDCIK